MADSSGASRASSRNLFVDFDVAPLPDAIDAFRFRVHESAESTGIERYALRLFGEIDLARLRTVMSGVEIGLARIPRMNAFYLNFDHERVGQDDKLLLYQVETVLNRLLRLMDRVGDASPSEEACSVLDLRDFQRIPSAVRDMLDQAGASNPWARPGTVRCTPGGEWDLRTRLAALCESFSPITRLDYGFDCDAGAGAVALWFTAPDASAMPHTVCDENAAIWRELDDAARTELAGEHAARIALVLAAAAFAAGMKVERCSVTVRPARAEGEARTYAFERPAFFAVCIPLAERLSGRRLFNAPTVAALEPACGEPVIAAASTAPDPRRLPIVEDTRSLPPALRDLLMADTVSELNIMEPEDSPSMRRFKELRSTAAMRGSAELERALSELVGELEGTCAVQELTACTPTTSQFCENALCRVLLPLLSDDRSQRISRAPDALFFAQHELSGLYARQGRYDMALAEARRTLDVASTSVQAHFALINILARLELFDDLIEVCRHGLRTAYDRRSAAYYFYRMAFSYWNLGERELALACYALVPQGEQVSPVAHMEMRTLMLEMGVVEPPSVKDAAATVQAAGIVLAPSSEVSDQISDAAVMLVDGGFFTLARACVSYLWQVVGSDELGAVARSLAC